MKTQLEEKENPYLKIGFWDGLAYTILFVILFPWSLLYLLIFRGIENTKDFLVFFVRDLLITIVITVISIILIIVPAIYYLVSWIAQLLSWSAFLLTLRFLLSYAMYTSTSNCNIWDLYLDYSSIWVNPFISLDS